MNITITQDNSRVEVLGSNGANIIKKLYELAIDPNNTLTLEGNISSTAAYADHVTYLTTNYPDLIINATKLYMTFRDPHVVSALLAQGVGDGTGITMSDLDGITLDGNGGTGKVTFRNNTDIEYFEEFKYFTNGRVEGISPFYGCSNLKLISFPLDYTSSGGWFLDVFCSFVVPSLKWFLEYGVSEWALPRTGNWNIPEENWGEIYIGNTNNKLEDVIVTSDIVVNQYRILRNSNIKTLEWETNSNIPNEFCILCKKLNSLTITAQNVQIGENAFYECTSLLAIDGFSNISAFKGNCFFNCPQAVSNASLMQLSITLIGLLAFYNNYKMTGSLNLPNLVSLGAFSFAATGISSIVNLGSITTIPILCFNSCTNLTSVVLPNSCTTLLEGAFNRCSSLSQINLSNRITEFGRYCFTECSSLNISASVLTNATIIGETAFNGIASLSGDLVLSHLTLIGGWPFGNRTLGITSADFTGSTFTQIYAGLFENQTSLDHVILPATLTTVTGWGHFTDTPLRWIKFLGTTAPTGLGVNSMGIRAAAKIYVPDAAVNDYKASLTEYASLIYGMSLFATDFPNG